MNQKNILGERATIIGLVLMGVLLLGFFVCACSMPNDSNTIGTMESFSNESDFSEPIDSETHSTETDRTEIYPTEHDHQWTVIVTQPTCEENGFTTFSCLCGESFIYDETLATGHDWMQATCTEAKSCATCGATEGVAKGHNWKGATCSVCGYSNVDDFKDPIAEEYEVGTLVFYTDGVARLYGENGQVINTYVGWVESRYLSQSVPWYSDKDNITNVIIQNGVSPNYTDYWFYEYSNLINVSVGDGVTKIGNSAFCRCRNLCSITISDSVTSIERYAFSNCDKLIDVVLPETITSIGVSALSSCDSLMSMNIPKGVTDIPAGTFNDCEKLTNIIIPDSVTHIGRGAFADCKNLSSVTIGKGVTDIGENVFWNCESLSAIIFEGTVAEFSAIKKGNDWQRGVPATHIQCSDGTVKLT